MYAVELYLRVRLACHVDGLSQREAASRFGIARETVKKMLRQRSRVHGHGVREWLAQVAVKTLYIGPGGPCENGGNESINGKPGGGLRDGENFYVLKEARERIEQWRRHYNTVRPHSALGYRPPGPQAIAPRRTDPAFAMDELQPDQPFPETVP